MRRPTIAFERECVTVFDCEMRMFICAHSNANVSWLRSNAIFIVLYVMMSLYNIINVNNKITGKMSQRGKRQHFKAKSTCN